MPHKIFLVKMFIKFLQLHGSCYNIVRGLKLVSQVWGILVLYFYFVSVLVYSCHNYLLVGGKVGTSMALPLD